MAETNEFFIKIGADVDDAMSKLNLLSNRLSTFASNTQRSGNQISGSLGSTSKVISAAFSEIGLALTTVGIVGGILGIGKAALTTSAQMEQIKVSFEVFTGSVESADQMLSKLKAQALASPMQFQDITKGAQTLLQYGLTAQQVTPITRMLGDISSGNADKFQRLTLAFGQVNAAGRLMGQEARQMINAGFNPLKAISDKTGESMAVLTKRMHDGGITVQDVADAFTFATSEGGQFFGMADKQSQTLQGAFNKLSESITFVLADIGDGIAKAFNLNDLANTVNKVMGDINTAFKENKDVVEALGYMVDRVKFVFSIFGNVVIFLVNAFQLLSSAFVYFRKTFEPVRDFFLNLTIKAYEFLKSVRYVGDALEWLIGKFTKIDNTKSVKLPEIDKSEATGLSNKSSKEIVPKKTKKSEADKQYERDLEEMKRSHEKYLDENYKRQERLVEIEKNTLYKLSTLNMSAEDKALSDLKNEFDEKRKIYEEGNRSIANLEILYNQEREKIQKEFSHKKALKAIQDLQDELKGLNSEYPKGFNDFVDEFVTNTNENKIRDYSKAMTSALSDFGVNIFTGFSNIAGSALAGITTFGDAISQVGSMFLSLVGDLLIQMGTSAIKLGISAESIQAVLATIGIPGGGMAAIAVGTLAVAAGSLLKGMATKTDSAISARSSGNQVAVKSGGSTGMASGSSYSYGGPSYSTQSMRLAIDLTGSITSTQTGYAINKSFETTLRVTGR